MSELIDRLNELEKEIDLAELAEILEALAFDYALLVLRDVDQSKHENDARKLYWLNRTRELFKEPAVLSV